MQQTNSGVSAVRWDVPAKTAGGSGAVTRLATTLATRDQGATRCTARYLSLLFSELLLLRATRGGFTEV